MVVYSCVFIFKKELLPLSAGMTIRPVNASWARRLCAGVGCVMIVTALSGLANQFDPADTKFVCARVVIGWVIAAWGVTFCLAARFPYAFGIRMAIGVVCFSIAAIVTGCFVDCCIAGAISIPLFVLAALMFKSGCYCFSVRRHVSRNRH